MDERETVRRRDAVVGLGFLGAMLVAVMGTIFYRIVDPKPSKAMRPSPHEVAGEFGDGAKPLPNLYPDLTPEVWRRQDEAVKPATFSESTESPPATSREELETYSPRTPRPEYYWPN